MILRIYIAIPFLVLFFSSASAETYQDCIIENLQNTVDRAAVIAIKKACKDKTTPKKCREYLNNTRDYFQDTLDELAGIGTELERCLKECEESSFWARSFGECSTN